jgi:pyrroloquinoline quinone biosynthesis protein D
MMAPDGRPLLKAGCRLSPAGDVLLIPEGALRLRGPACRILQACDGKKTAAEIVATLLTEFPDADQTKVSKETLTFLKKLVDRSIIELV